MATIFEADGNEVALSDKALQEIAETYAWPFEWEVATRLKQERDEARAQLANAAAREVDAVQGRQECEAELLEARARIEALESALRQYADREAWTDTVSELLEPEGPWEPEFPPSESLAHTVSVELHANTHFDYDGDGWELAEKALGLEDAA